MPADRVQWVKWWAAVALLIEISFGCAARPSAFHPTVLSGHRIDHVPFVPGDPGACGPAALSSLLAYWGDPVSVDAIARALARPSLAGVLPLDLARFADDRVSRPPPEPSRGVTLEATEAIGSIDWLRGEVRRDRPVIVFLDLGFGPWRRGHFVVVVGYDDAAGDVALYSGRDPRAIMSYARFTRAWQRAGSWALRLAPSDAVGVVIPETTPRRIVERHEQAAAGPLDGGS
jgi:hypothetical protein